MPQPPFNGCRQPDQCLADGTAAHRALNTKNGQYFNLGKT